MGQVTQLAQYRMVRQRPITALCIWSGALEQIMLTNVRFCFACQRTWLRQVGLL